MEEIGIILKTFLRDDYLKKFIETQQQHYPEIKIYIGDDGLVDDDKVKYYNKLRKMGHEAYYLPWNIGLSKGRNFLAKRVREKYVLIGDDDFYFMENTNLEAMVKLLDSLPEVGVVGGALYENGTIRSYEGFIEKKGKTLHYSKMTHDNWERLGETRYKTCGITFNFALIRREVLEEVLWDQNIHVSCEHSDFFMEVAKTKWKVIYTPDAIIGHKHEDIDPGKTCETYLKNRVQLKDWVYFGKKWEVENGFDMNGREMIYKEQKYL